MNSQSQYNQFGCFNNYFTNFDSYKVPYTPHSWNLPYRPYLNPFFFCAEPSQTYQAYYPQNDHGYAQNNYQSQRYLHQPYFTHLKPHPHPHLHPQNLSHQPYPHHPAQTQIIIVNAPPCERENKNQETKQNSGPFRQIFLRFGVKLLTKLEEIADEKLKLKK